MGPTGREGACLIVALGLASIAACGSSKNGAGRDGGAGGAAGAATSTGGQGGGGVAGRGGAGGAVGCPPPATCGNDLSGTLAFAITFDIRVTNLGVGGILLSQRGSVACDNPMAAHWWQLSLLGDGRLGFGAFLGSYPTAIETTIPVGDGATHTVSICRVAPDAFLAFTDGQPSAVSSLRGGFASLPPLVVGGSGCAPSTVTGVTLTNVCLGAP